MNTNKKYIIFPIVFVLAIWTFNIIRHQIYFLDEPIFIKSFIEKEIVVQLNEEAPSYQNCIIDLYYIDNFSNNTYVSEGINYTTLSFPEVNSQDIYTVNNNGGFDMFNGGNTYVEGVTIAPYRVNVLRIDLGQVFLNNGKTLIDKVKEETEVKISKVRFGYGDNSRTIDIGDITLRAVAYPKEEDSVIRFISSGGSNNGSGDWDYFQYEALKDIEITGLEGEAYETVKDFIKLEINNEELQSIKFPVKIKSGGIFNVGYGINFGESEKLVEPMLIDGYLTLNIMDNNKEVQKVNIRISNWYNSIAEYLKKAGNINKLFNE